VPRPDLSVLPQQADLEQTAIALAEDQLPSGEIPWFPGGHTDPWDHVECAMAMTVGRNFEAAIKAYEWLRRTQADNGGWPMATVEGKVTDAAQDSNQVAYVAVGVLHYFRSTGDEAFLERMWPVVRRALDFVVELQTPGGEIMWARNPQGEPHPHVLLTGCSSTLQALRCGLALAEAMDDPQPDWELATGALQHVLGVHPEAFTERDRFSMDWYYPVLGGALTGEKARERIARSWETFIVPGLGCRCVNDEPWVTGAETCELAIAMHLAGDSEGAVQLVAQQQHLRTDEGRYWTGWQFAAAVHWPDECSTWTAAAVVLAVDVLRGGVTEGVFRGDGIPQGLAFETPVDGEICGCGRPLIDA
jgi:hypothetical protein